MPVSDLRAAIVAAAELELELGDSPQTDGRLGRYWASCGINPWPSPHSREGQWCGVFCLAMFHAAGVALDVMWIPGRGFIYPQHLKPLKAEQALAGDVLYLDAPYRHHALLTGPVVAGRVPTIDGNQPGLLRHNRYVTPKQSYFSIGSLLPS